ncbi:MAG: CDP-alcohol phosphatidyltransferase family protein [Sulfurihydrogenibium sp.]
MESVLIKNNVANILTLIRLILVPAFIIAIWYNKPLTALVLFTFAGLTDAVDGYIARKFNQVTLLGKILDPIADKTLLVSAFLFIFNSQLSIKFPFWFVVLVISRDVYILAGSVLIYLVKGSIKVNPTVFGKATTFFQITTVIYILLANINLNLYNDFVYYGLIGITFLFMVLSTMTYTYYGFKQLGMVK